MQDVLQLKASTPGSAENLKMPELDPMFTLSLAVIGAQGLKNNELFTKQDPYVVLQYAGQVLRTKTDIGECRPVE